MGFLDHSTNNIILDAVLTDTGRQFLSRNDGSFSLTQFALGDDEVNYNIISKYGRSVGKEKIEKNTPIFEALTNQSQAQKFTLVSVSNPNLVRLPNFSLASNDNSYSNGYVNLYTTNNKGKLSSSSLTVAQQLIGESLIDVELRDATFLVDVPNLFLSINNGNASPLNVDNQQRAYYSLTGGVVSSNQGGQLTFSISVKSISQTLFDVYGTGSGKSVIKTYVRVTGMQSGSVKDIAVSINQTQV